MSKRVSPCERLHAQIDEVFAGGADLAVALERVAQLGAQLLLQAAIEGEVGAFLGRERYERSATCERRPSGNAQRLLRDHDQDHRRAGDRAAAEAARHDRTVRLPAVRYRGDQDQRAGERW